MVTPNAFNRNVNYTQYIFLEEFHLKNHMN